MSCHCGCHIQQSRSRNEIFSWKYPAFSFPPTFLASSSKVVESRKRREAKREIDKDILTQNTIIHLDLSDQVREAAKKSIPLQRFGTAEEVADAAIFLSTNQYANNCILNLDGGLSAI